MTQLPCRVPILTPETGRFEPLKALSDQTEPGLRSASRRPRERPVTLSVRDDGRKFDPAQGGKEDRHRGRGLRIMSRRANRLGATLVAGAFDPALDRDRAGRTA